MQQAAYGIFKKGQIILNEQINAPDETNVIVVFLDNRSKFTTQNQNELLNLFDSLGAWEDSREADTIIDEITKSRISKRTDVVL